MRSSLVLALTAILLGALGLTSEARAWNSFGHMEVAALAWERLSPPTRTRIEALLKLNPSYSEWVANVDEKDRGRTAFMRAAVWADTIKGDPAYQNDGPANGNIPPSGLEASQNLGYADKLRHKYWHFLDLPFSTDGTPLRDTETPNAQTQIAAFVAALPAASGVSDDVRSYDLVWLIHLVGDVHQPLHTTSRFSQGQLKGDAGGNFVQIKCGGCSDRELHAFWDDVLGSNKATVDEVIRAAAELPPPSPNLAMLLDESVWIAESFEAAKQHVYAAPPIGEGTGPFTLSSEYKEVALTIAKQRVALAGARLAGLLESRLR